MSAQVTEAHRELARRIMFEFTQAGTATASDVRMAAQIIADSEAKAVAEWQNFVHLKGEAIDSLLLECNQLRAELAAERARLDYIDSLSPGDAWGIYRSSAQQNANLHAGDPRTLRKIPGIRAAIDAAMKEGTK